MPSGHPKDDHTASNSCSGDHEVNSTKNEIVDVSKVNELIDNVNTRLSGGLHGPFFEAGSRLDEKARHGQLELLFNLSNQLTEIKAQLDRQVYQPRAAMDKSAKGPFKANDNLVSTIKNVVDQQLADKLRDMAIENDRLRQEIRKEAEVNENKVKALERKIKKLEQQAHTTVGYVGKVSEHAPAQDYTPAATEYSIKVLENRLDAVERSNVSHPQLNTVISTVNKNAMVSRQKQNDTRDRLTALEEWKERHSSSCQANTTARDLLSMPDNAMNKLNGWTTANDDVLGQCGRAWDEGNAGSGQLDAGCGQDLLYDERSISYIPKWDGCG